MTLGSESDEHMIMLIVLLSSRLSQRQYISLTQSCSLHRMDPVDLHWSPRQLSQSRPCRPCRQDTSQNKISFINIVLFLLQQVLCTVQCTCCMHMMHQLILYSVKLLMFLHLHTITHCKKMNIITCDEEMLLLNSSDTIPMFMLLADSICHLV